MSVESTLAGGASIRYIFTNREDDIAKISSDYSPAITVVSGPAGYGKTELLLELRRRFEEKDWVVAYVTFTENSKVSHLPHLLAAELGLDSDDKWQMPSRISLGGRFANAVFSRLQGKVSQKGLVILIDIDKSTRLDSDELGDLRDFITDVMRTLSASTFFQEKHNPFRVVLAGRNIVDAATTDSDIDRFFENKITLEPFDYAVILRTAEKYLPSRSSSVIPQLAAHLLFVTGGHPGCIAGILEMYESHYGLVPEDFFLEHERYIWIMLVQPVVDVVRDEIPESFEGFRTLLDSASVFRWLDNEILAHLLKSNGLLGRFTPHDLADRLTETYLYNRELRLLRDAITRRLLAIRLRHNDVEKFSRLCSEAQDICAQHILYKESPERWLIEYLFESLQQHAGAISDGVRRETISTEFFDRVLPQGLELYFDKRNVSRPELRTEYEALVGAMQKDWEFIFTVNYYLRDDGFTTDQFKKLRDTVKAFFERRQA